MTSLKPQLIRADTLDLQSPESPSAKDHSRQPTHPSPTAPNSAAPHQNQTLRSVEQHALLEQMNGPGRSHDRGRGKFPDEPDFYDDPDDDGPTSRFPDGDAAMQSPDDSGLDESDIGDQADDDGLDDDMMDRISSSPSIDDDGKYPSPFSWPSRVDSVKSGATPSSVPSLNDDDEPASSSSPYVSTPEHYPVYFRIQDINTPHCHHHGKYPAPTMESPISPSPGRFEGPKNGMLAQFHEAEEEIDNRANGLEINDINHLLVPLDDPLLGEDDEFETDQDILVDYPTDGPDWEDDDRSETDELDFSTDDDTGNLLLTADSRFIDSGWGGECLREAEDIDFEFVYALHTFVATVEGQANATKGDTMVLLDDSNSYWWLVRVVKDGSIGYLPAEHIETPTERLARLNKRRNIDLSATMLSDNAEKSKKSLKKAMRRRNAKTVQFSAPQYFEPSDVEYSDDEEMMDEDFEKADNLMSPGDQDRPDTDEPDADANSTSIMKPDRSAPMVNGVQAQHNNNNEASSGGSLRSPDGDRPTDELSAEDQREDVGVRSKRSLVRSTDSFLKDDEIETKKISLTPRLLQGDSNLASGREESEPRPKSSVESFDKILSPDHDKLGEEKKKKEKKGMLGGFFKRKEKKGRAADSEGEEGKKAPSDTSRVTPQSKKSSESLSQEARPTKGDKSFQRQGSKLQKQPPPHISPKTSPSKDNLHKVEQESIISPSSQESASTPSTVQSPVPEQSNAPEDPSRSRSPEISPERAASPSERKTIFTTMTDALKPGPTRLPEGDRQLSAAPVVTKPSSTRAETADGHVGQDSGPTQEWTQVQATLPTLDTAAADKGGERLSESPIEVSPIEQWESQKSSIESQPPTLMVDTSSNSERRSISPLSPTSSSSSSLVDGDAETPNEAEELTNPTATSPNADAATSSTARSTPTWSDASLRTYMDNDEDIRDLLIIVHDKSNVIPAGPDHPITGNLFCAEKGRLADMQANLDSMLTNWLARKNQTALPR